MKANEPQILVEKVSRSTKILNAEYIFASLEEVIKKCEKLNPLEQHQLLQVLQKYEHLFDGTLVAFNMDPISLKLIEQQFKTVHDLVPRSVF